MKFTKFISNDYPGIFCISITIVGLVLIFISGKNSNPSLNTIIAMGALSLLTLVIFIHRYMYLNKLFSTGLSETAIITDVTFLRKNGTITFNYTYEGEEHKAKNSVSRNRQTKGFREGDTVEIVIDSANSSKAYIKELFC